LKQFIEIFNSAMECITLGLCEKKQIKDSNDIYKYSPLLKKGMDKFAILNLIYLNEGDRSILPTDENSLISTFNFSIINLIDKFPEKYIEGIKNETDWYIDSEFISVTGECKYYITEELNQLIFNERKYRKSIKAICKEFELESQKFYQLISNKEQDEYSEIRNFLEQKNHVYLTNSQLFEDDDVRDFKKKYSDIIERAYNIVPYNEVELKICPYCGLVLKEKEDGILYCISEKCSKKSNGFIDVKSMKLTDKVYVLNDSVAYSIYYPGMLEQEIKIILDKLKIDYDIWPDLDTYDFSFEINGEKWAIDAKDVKRYYHISHDIEEMSKKENEYDKVLYVVPNDKSKAYLDAINRKIDTKKYSCITLKRLKQMLDDGGIL